ncbi:hypothetical protein [Streptomyces sp. CB03238]|uniref:hypothetical protein n=1 Tax=Streptomyces sp. CB03238 TaxID=1907777 RepID=UPI0019D43F67
MDRFHERERFAWFVDHWSSKESRSCVVGLEQGAPTGFAYGLLVDVRHPKVQALYETWGHEKLGEQKPFDDSPVFAIMVKRLTVPA